MALAVTVLYDLAQLEDEPRRRGIGEYLSFGKSLFRGNFDLHVFCGPELVAKCEELLSERPQGASTVIEALPFSDLPGWRIGEVARIGFEEGKIKRTSSTANQVKDSVFANTLWWSKLGLMERAAENLKHANHQSLWWIDFGIAHASGAIISEIHDVAMPKFGVLRQLNEIADEDYEFFQTGIPIVAGGMFAIPRAHIQHVKERFEAQLDRVISMGLLVNDESILSWLVSSEKCDVVETTFDQIISDLLIPLTKQERVVTINKKVFEDESLIDISEYVLRRIRLPDPEHTDQRATNPSIAVHPDGGFLCIVRHVNYVYEQGFYRQIDGSDVVRTENVLVKMNRDFDIEWSSIIDDQKLCEHAELFPVFGLEDARLFQRDDEWWMSGTCREHRVDGRCQIFMCRLKIDELNSAQIEFTVQLPFLSENRHEKNWMPIVGSEHSWVWGVQPTVRCRFDDVTGSLVPSRTAKGDLSIRGSSQVVPWKNGWLAVVHDVEMVNGLRTYRHRFVRWSDLWEIEFVSPPFRLGDDAFGLEFCAGLVVLDGGQRLLLSVGIGDSRAEIVAMEVPAWL
jgi:predicted GH43/DUF377 family glycosyl hydrolase